MKKERGNGILKEGMVPLLGDECSGRAPLQMEIGRDPRAISRTIPTYLQPSPPSNMLSNDMPLVMSQYQLMFFLDPGKLTTNEDFGRKEEQTNMRRDVFPARRRSLLFRDQRNTPHVSTEHTPPDRLLQIPLTPVKAVTKKKQP